MRKRIQQVKAAMAAHGIHTLLTFDPKNVNYLTGFHTTARPIWQIGRTACLLSADGTWRLFLPAPWDREYAPRRAARPFHTRAGTRDWPGSCAAITPPTAGNGRLPIWMPSPRPCTAP